MTCIRLTVSIRFVVLYFSASIAFLLLATVAGYGQSNPRLVRSPECPFIEEETILELTEVRVAGKKVSFDQTFDADHDWLKNLVFRVKNIGQKPLAVIRLTFGLLERVDEDLPQSASFEYGLQFIQSKRVASKQARLKLPVLIQPGEEVELTSEGCLPYGLRHLDSLLSGAKPTRDTISLAATSGRRFRKAEIMSADVQFADGTVGKAQLLLRLKCEEH